MAQVMVATSIGHIFCKCITLSEQSICTLGVLLTTTAKGGHNDYHRPRMVFVLKGVGLPIE